LTGYPGWSSPRLAAGPLRGAAFPRRSSVAPQSRRHRGPLARRGPGL